MLPRVLLLGAECSYWPGTQPLPHWSPRPAALLGRLDCRAALLRPELDRLPDLLCLQLDSAAGRSGRLFRRTFALRAVREVGSWSEADGLRVTDRRTGIQPDGRIITDGSPLRVAFLNFRSGRYTCQRSPINNLTCSSVGLKTLMPMYREIQLDLEVMAMPRLHNMTLEFVDAMQYPSVKRRGRLPKLTGQAVQVLRAGGADRTWPYIALTADIFRHPVTFVDGHRLLSFTFMTVRRPPRLDSAQLARLFSPATWVTIGSFTLVVTALLALVMRGSSPGHAALSALAMLLGQGVSLSAGRLPPRYRPLVAVWIAMSLVLSTAYLSDLIKALTVPRDNPPRTAKDLIDQDYRLFSEAPYLKRTFSRSPSPHIRELARTMRLDVPREDMPRALLNEPLAFSLEQRTLFELSVHVMHRSDGSVLFDNLNFGSEVFGHMVLVRLWSKHHPLVPQRSLSVARMVASGLISNGRFENQARHLGLRVKSRACARRLPSCYTRGVVRSLSLANVRGPLMLYGAGAALALLALLLEIAVARVAGMRRQTRASDSSDSASSARRHSDSQGLKAGGRLSVPTITHRGKEQASGPIIRRGNQVILPRLRSKQVMGSV